MDLWRNLDAYRQEAAEAVLTEAIMRHQDPSLAVQHVLQVLEQNAAPPELR